MKIPKLGGGGGGPPLRNFSHIIPFFFLTMTLRFSDWLMFLRLCQILGISSGYVQSMFRVCSWYSEYVQSMFKVCSEYVQIVNITSSSASSVSVFGLFFIILTIGGWYFLYTHVYCDPELMLWGSFPMLGLRRHNCNLKNLCPVAHLEGRRGNCAGGEVFDQTRRGHARRVTHKDDLDGLHWLWMSFFVWICWFFQGQWATLSN